MGCLQKNNKALKESFIIFKVVLEINKADMQNNSVQEASIERLRDIFQKTEHKQRDGTLERKTTNSRESAQEVHN